jgi:uncharacterized protein YcbX
MSGRVTDLFHYPVKGLSAQRLKRVELIPGEGFPFDRVFGLARHDSEYDPSYFRPLPKTQFIVLVREERLAELQTCFDPKTRRLQIRIAGNPAFEDELSSAPAIARTIDFFATMFDLGPERRPIFADAGANRFTDISVVSREMMNAVSLINLESVRELARLIGQELHPLRFRANIYFDGLPPFSELDLLNREIAIGPARLRVTMRTGRCAATEVNPETARRDIPVPRLLLQHLGHANMGVYAEVLDGGGIESGALVSV